MERIVPKILTVVSVPGIDIKSASAQMTRFTDFAVNGMSIRDTHSNSTGINNLLQLIAQELPVYTLSHVSKYLSK